MEKLCIVFHVGTQVFKNHIVVLVNDLWERSVGIWDNVGEFVEEKEGLKVDSTGLVGHIWYFDIVQGNIRKKKRNLQFKFD